MVTAILLVSFQVFKRSLLCEQLREGAKKGRLIGDDAYRRESFLLTPNSGKRFKKGMVILDGIIILQYSLICTIPEEHHTFNETLSNAHKFVQEAIANWKRQFPILTSDIMFVLVFCVQ